MLFMIMPSSSPHVTWALRTMNSGLFKKNDKVRSGIYPHPKEYQWTKNVIIVKDQSSQHYTKKDF